MQEKVGLEVLVLFVWEDFFYSFQSFFLFVDFSTQIWFFVEVFCLYEVNIRRYSFFLENLVYDLFVLLDGFFLMSGEIGREDLSNLLI